MEWTAPCRTWIKFLRICKYNNLIYKKKKFSRSVDDYHASFLKRKATTKDKKKNVKQSAMQKSLKNVNTKKDQKQKKKKNSTTRKPIKSVWSYHRLGPSIKSCLGDFYILDFNWTKIFVVTFLCPNQNSNQWIIFFSSVSAWFILRIFFFFCLSSRKRKKKKQN